MGKTTTVEVRPELTAEDVAILMRAHETREERPSADARTRVLLEALRRLDTLERGIAAYIEGVG